MKTKRWKPKERELFYYIQIMDNQYIIDNTEYCKGYRADELDIKMGNCFRTKKEAQAKLKKIKEILREN